MTEEEELKEAFPEEIDYDPNSSDNYEPPDVYSLDRRLDELNKKVAHISAELHGMFNGAAEVSSGIQKNTNDETNKIKKAIAQMVITEAGDKSNG